MFLRAFSLSSHYNRFETVSPALFVEFNDARSLQTFFRSLSVEKKSFQSSTGSTIKVKPATTKVNQDRIWALREAGKKLAAAGSVCRSSLIGSSAPFQ